MREGWYRLATVFLFSVPFSIYGNEKAVRYEQVRNASEREIWELNGEVISLLRSNLSSEMFGKVTSIRKEGEVVQKGQVVATLDDSRWKLEVAIIRSNLKRSEATLLYWKRQKRRIEALLANSSVAEQELALVERSYSELTHQMSATRNELQLAERSLSLTKITAPFSGVITRKIASEGEHVEPGDALVTLVNVRSLEVRAFAPLSLRAELSIGGTALVEGQGIEETGTITSIIPVSDSSTRMIDTRLSVTGKNWWPGEPVKVSFQPHLSEGKFLVSRDALIRKGEEVMVAKIDQEKKARWISVTLIEPVGDSVIVSSELLRAQDKIVVIGAEGLSEGQTVKIL